MGCARDNFTYIRNNSEIQQLMSDFSNVLNGQGPYDRVIASDGYQ